MKIFSEKKVNTRIIIASLWISHFLLWTFGDMASLLQRLNEPIANSLLLFVAVPLAIIQVSMIVFNLVGKYKLVGWTNIVIAFVFILINIGFIYEAHAGWEYLLGIAYLTFNFLIIKYAWVWKK